MIAFENTKMLMHKMVRFSCIKPYDLLHPAATNPDRITTLEFELCPFSLNGRETLCIYECISCTGCGCPTFSKAENVPTEIVEHLERHVLMHMLNAYGSNK